MVLPFVLIKQLILFGLLAASGSIIYLSPGWDETSFSPSRKGRQDGRGVKVMEVRRWAQGSELRG